MRDLLRCAGAAAVLLLCACVAQPVREAPAMAPAAAESAQSRREALLAPNTDWGLQGRVALATGRKGGSGRLDWRQQGGHYEVALSAPVTRQSWRLLGDDSHARLEGLDGGPREGSDAAALLQETTGWVIPVDALASWVRGIRAPGLQAGSVRYALDGHLDRLEQGGWTIDYDDWRTQPGFGVELPHRLTASQGEARVRLVVDQWIDTATP